MKELASKLSLVVLGVLLGAFLVTTLPVEAHDAAKIRRLERRLSHLEFQLDRPDGCSVNDAVGWYSEGALFERFSCDAEIAPSQIDVPPGCSGNAAVWEISGLDC